MEEVESLKIQIRMVRELLEKKPYQNDGMRKQLADLEAKLKEKQDVQN